MPGYKDTVPCVWRLDEGMVSLPAEEDLKVIIWHGMVSILIDDDRDMRLIVHSSQDGLV